MMSNERVRRNWMYQSEYDIQASKLMIGRYSRSKDSIFRVSVWPLTLLTPKNQMCGQPWTGGWTDVRTCISYTVYSYINIYKYATNCLQHKSYIIIHHTQHTTYQFTQHSYGVQNGILLVGSFYGMSSQYENIHQCSYSSTL